MAKNFGVLDKELTRRDFMKAVGVAGLGLVGQAALAGCAPKATPAPKATATPEPPPTPHVAEIGWSAWRAREDVEQALIDRFNEHYPNINVAYERIPWNKYLETLVTKFTVGGAPDGLMVHYAAPGWVKAGYLQPVDQMPGFDEIYQDMPDACRMSIDFGGRAYGLPQYMGCTCFMYNEEILEKAGISEPPKDLLDVKEQCLIIKDKGIMEYPMMAPEIITTNGRPYYALLYASGGRLFDDSLEPIPLSENKLAVEVLDWCGKAHHEWKIMDPSGYEQNWEPAANIFNAGGLAFQLNGDWNLMKANDPNTSQIVGQARLMLMPGLGSESMGTWGQTWWYGMNSETKEPEATWEFIKYMSAKDWTGEYYCATAWLREFGNLPAYNSMYEDPDAIKLMEKAGDLDLLTKHQSMAKPMETFHEPYFSEWTDFFASHYQKVCTGEMEAEEALQLSLDKHSELKAGYA